MTEPEWLACTEPRPMLDFLQGKASERKLRLFAVACGRRLWHLLPDERSRKAVEVAEQFAEGNATVQELAAAHEAAYAVFYPAALPIADSAGHAAAAAAFSAAYSTAEAVVLAGGAASLAGGAAARRDQAMILRDLFGNPFRAAALDPRWLTASVVALTRTIDAERACDALPILADALEDTGCNNAALLTHLRSDGPHGRGCWSVDLILGKS